ncbi:hypothetical protein CONPUDRAFT_170439 [Coniophora puteana RWD-64-598 SS2]|uniref:Uncharacterized protein n=1 Tax=Coniophora puteana (strain RWD-64-598) TaxID=741705 RepID=R7SC97_CONPW|nr:uncharacterized protein CONPUDRAFT_170439 [Coniophora puteana RWD-64-598 SS2]EIW73773.1 hypothetical protein CONPUDRAFT_170439 [Coniophora puteana RWD-64-598 SS2]
MYPGYIQLASHLPMRTHRRNFSDIFRRYITIAPRWRTLQSHALMAASTSNIPVHSSVLTGGAPALPAPPFFLATALSIAAGSITVSGHSTISSMPSSSSNQAGTSEIEQALLARLAGGNGLSLTEWTGLVEECTRCKKRFAATSLRGHIKEGVRGLCGRKGHGCWDLVSGPSPVIGVVTIDHKLVPVHYP